MEDALISPLGLAILSGAGLLDNDDAGDGQVHIHKTGLEEIQGELLYTYYIGYNGTYTEMTGIDDDAELKAALLAADETGNTAIDVLVKRIDDNEPGGQEEAVDHIMTLVTTANSVPVSFDSKTDAPIIRILADGSTIYLNVSKYIIGGEKICATAPMYILTTEPDGSIQNKILDVASVDDTTNIITLTPDPTLSANQAVYVDFYAIAQAGTTKEIQIDAEHFAGYFYVEADTLFRRQIDGKDCPAIITLPNVKIQSNFSFSLSSSGDPSELMRSAA